MKKTLTDAPVLIHFDPQLPIEVRVDASGIGLGACLLQNKDGFRPVAYASRLLNNVERNYTVTEQECLAMIFALERFHPYLEEREFVLYTDHCALCWIRQKNKLPPRLMRYAMLIQDFYFTVIHKQGKHQKDADCLSRYPIEQSKEENRDDHMFAFNLSEAELSIKDAQKDDNEARILKETLDYDSPYEIIDDVLYHKTVTATEVKFQVNVPKKLRQEILHSYHNSPFFAHIGEDATLAIIKE